MREIKTGDMVVIVYQCCSVDSELGHVFRVTKVLETGTGCSYCGDTFEGLCAEAADGSGPHAVPLHWLKRIPPLEELEGQNQKEDLREPA